MIPLTLARSLRDAGLRWEPGPGDCFVIADREMDDTVFVLADMTTEVHHFPTGPVIGFNGTTEWALDSVEQDDALWLPRENQLRDLLGTSFHRLTRTTDGYQVDLRDGRHASADTADEAYGMALLQVIAAD